MVDVENKKHIQNVDIKVGFTCNNNCIHCVVANKRCHDDLTFEEIIRELDHFIGLYKEISIVLTGGEFTIRPDIFQIMEEISLRKRQKKISKVILQTNGCALADFDLSRYLSKSVDEFFIAVHAPYAELHDVITRTPGSFWQTIRGIQNIQDCIRNGARCRLVTQTVISRFNYPLLPELIAIIRNGLKLNEVRLTFPHPNGNAYSPGVVPKYSEITPFINEALFFAKKNKMNVSMEQIPLCIIDKALHRIYKGKILAKKKYAVGYDRSLLDRNGRTNYAETLLKEYRKTKACAKCKLNNLCIGIWKEYLEFYVDYDLPAIK